jgi:hypothetical protein
MTHVSADTLHELLDGTLDPERRREVQAHFAGCAACAAQLASTQRMMEETSRLVAALDNADTARAAGGDRPRDPDPYRDERGASWPRPSVPPEPVVLIPLPPEDPRPPLRRPRRRGVRPGLLLAVAAVLLLGVAWGITSARRATGLGDVSFAPGDRGSRGVHADTLGGRAAGTVRSDTLSPAQLAMRIAADSLDPGDSGDTSRSPASTPAAAGAPPRAAPAAPAPKPAAAATDSAATPRSAARDSAPSAVPAKTPRSINPAAAQSAARKPLPPDREAAARATADLDREIRRQRAAEATAQLDRSRARSGGTARRATAAAVPSTTAPAARSAGDSAASDTTRANTAPADSVASAPPAPKPPSLDEQLGLERRIGLDEAAKMLGEPVHVIDGMRALAVGAVDGSAVPGADPTRPVVRVGYISQSGALVMLDQQRVRTLVGRPHEPGAGPAGPRLMIGDVLLYLHGRAPAEELRDLADRVR